MFTIQQIFQSSVYEIPTNQRGFSWTAKHVQALIDDLLLAGDEAHYLGPIIVTKSENPAFHTDDRQTTQEYTLEDGQQRLTTLVLILAEMSQCLLDLDGEPTLDSGDLWRQVFYQYEGIQLRLRNANPDLQQFMKHLLLDGTPAPAGVTAPMERLRAVKEFIAGWLRDQDRDQIMQWKNRFLNQAKAVTVDLRAEGVNRYLAFDAINSRGLPLGEFDKIKNFCILVRERRALGVDPATCWYEALTQLERLRVAKRSDEAEFITDLFNTYHAANVSRDMVHSAFVERYTPLLQAADPALEARLLEFVGLWEQYAKSFGVVASATRSRHYGELCTRAAGKWLEQLDHMRLPGITRKVLVAAHLRLGDEDFIQVAKACEIYTFRVHATCRYRTDNNVRAIITLANRVLRAGEGANYVLDKLCDWLHSFASMQRFIDKLAAGEPRYSWPRCYYFLYQYEVSVSPAGVDPLPWAQTKQLQIHSIEHVLPQEHRDGRDWEAAWPDELDAERFKHRLGNLTLTTDNRTLDRKKFADKHHDRAGGYCYSHDDATNSERRLHLFADKEEGGELTWTRNSILRRQHKLLEFAADRWSIPCARDNGVVYLPDEYGELEGLRGSLTVQHAPCFGTLEEPDEDGEMGDLADEDGGA